MKEIMTMMMNHELAHITNLTYSNKKTVIIKVRYISDKIYM